MTLTFECPRCCAEFEVEVTSYGHNRPATNWTPDESEEPEFEFPAQNCPTFTPESESCESVPAGLCGYAWAEDEKLIDSLKLMVRRWLAFNF